ncbi:MAG TPA: type IV pilus assembly protein PilM [Candidatus Saccharimonas sp.]|jgi:type IV pilus assembly protein PilM|nr:type IV pilus assembly protein PilM [Candidatus Saccharimonas sp.]
MSKLYYKDKPLIGLDISQTGIKVMSIDPKKWLVLGYGSLDLDPAKVQASMDNQEDTYLKDNITTLLKDNIVGSLNSDHVVVGLPTGRTFSRTFTIPASEEKHLSGAVEVEVDQYIPIPLSSLYVDYEVIEHSKDTLTVVMAAVPTTLVDACLAAVRAAGLTPIMAEPSINAVARVIEATEEGHLSTLIVDIGPASTDIAVFDKGAIRVSGGVGIGGNTFTLDIAKKLDVALENAHQLKVLNGLSAGPKQAKISAALRPSLQRITTEVRKVIRYYNERLNDDHKIEQVLVVGGGANVPGIGEYFTNELVMPARVASPWQKLDFGALQEPNKQFRPRYIAVAGLASVPREKVWK